MQCNGFVFVFFKQKTAYEMRISDWSSDVCSSDLASPYACEQDRMHRVKRPLMFPGENGSHGSVHLVTEPAGRAGICAARAMLPHDPERNALRTQRPPAYRWEEHTSELPSLIRISHAVFCLNKQMTTRKLFLLLHSGTTH